jgi:hypothetical protein
VCFCLAISNVKFSSFLYTFHIFLSFAFHSQRLWFFLPHFSSALATEFYSKWKDNCYQNLGLVLEKLFILFTDTCACVINEWKTYKLRLFLKRCSLSHESDEIMGLQCKNVTPFFDPIQILSFIFLILLNLKFSF